MNIFCIGLNHKSAPVEIRERLAIAESHLPEVNAEVAKLTGIAETVVLSTCNRTEIYAAHGEDSGPQRGLDALEIYIRDHFEMPGGEAVEFYKKQGADAVRHLFRVASGLDSMVLGETEIFGQVKSAYALAHRCGTTARNLNKLFQQTFSAGKFVRTHSTITSGATSVGAVAVDLAEKIFGDLKKCSVMVIGAGEMSRRTAKSLVSRGASGIIVSNRSYDKAVELADEMKGRAIRFDDCYDVIPEVDIVVASTSAPHAVLHPDHVQPAMRRRRGRPLFMIDIAVPRDIEPAVGELDGVYLYDIDALESIAESARRNRKKQITHCETLIDEQMEKLVAPGREKKPESSGDETGALPTT